MGVNISVVIGSCRDASLTSVVSPKLPEGNSSKPSEASCNQF